MRIGNVGYWSGLAAFTSTVAYGLVQILQVAGMLRFPADEILISGTSLCIVVPFIPAPAGCAPPTWRGGSPRGFDPMEEIASGEAGTDAVLVARGTVRAYARGRGACAGPAGCRCSFWHDNKANSERLAGS